MVIRTTQPKNNKYYITKAKGGYSSAIVGKPTIAGANVLCNCVGYAGSRFNEIIGKNKEVYVLVCNAENFIESAKKQGLKISSTPVQGGIMVWQKGATLGGGDGAGHVAVVEEVYDDGTILTSESGYNAWAFKTVKRNNSNGRWSQSSAYKFRGCIVNPSVTPKVVPAPKLTIDGIGGSATVRAMQKYFGTVQDGVLSGQNKSLSKYYPALIAVDYGKTKSTCVKNLQRWLGVTQDGIIGQGTVKAWQKKLGVTSDGIFGADSMRAWQKFLNDNWGKKAVYPIEPKPTGASKILAKAKEYAWPYGTAVSKYSYSKGSALAVYKTALKKYMNKSAKISQSDCGYFVSTCVRASGVSSTFLALPAKPTNAYPPIPSTMSLVHSGTMGSFTLKAGDIIRYRKTSSQHTVIYIGDGKIAHASRGSAFPRISATKPWNNSNVKKSTIQVIRAK